MNKSKIENKIKGSLYGFAIGDAMGATTEFRDVEFIKKHYGKVTNIIGGGAFNLPAGHGTDDTAMTLCVCEAIEYGFGPIRNWSFHEHDSRETAMLDRCCENFIEWLKTDGLGCGRCCYESIMANIYSTSYKEWIRKTFEPKDMPDDKRRLGNGSLMRTMPIVLAGLSEDLAISQGRLTHNNETCDWALLSYFRNMEEVLYNDTFLNSSLKPFSSNGHVINTLNNALYYVQHAMSFEDSIIMAVNAGGDADTIAAITGSLAGALYGYDAIPQRWIDQLSKDVKVKIDKYAKLFEEINKKVCTNTK